MAQQWASERTAVLVLPELRPRQRGGVKEAARVGCFVAQELKRVAVEGTAAGFGDDVDNAAARLRELRRPQRRLDTKLLHGLDGGNDRDSENVSIRVVRSVEEERVHGGTRA